MTLSETADEISACLRRKERELKDRLRLLHFLARDISQIFGSDMEHPPLELWDMFPALFAEDKAGAGCSRAEDEMALYRAQMIDYALRHNARRRGD